MANLLRFKLVIFLILCRICLSIFNLYSKTIIVWFKQKYWRSRKLWNKIFSDETLHRYRYVARELNWKLPSDKVNRKGTLLTNLFNRWNFVFSVIERVFNEQMFDRRLKAHVHFRMKRAKLSNVNFNVISVNRKKKHFHWSKLT